MGAIGLIVIYRVYLMVQHGYPLGWDGGMYRHYFLSHQSHLPGISLTEHFDRFVSWFPPLLGIIAAYLSTVWISADVVLVWWPPLLHISIALLCYSFLKPFGKVPALIAALLIGFSTLGYMVAWSGFLKQLLATVFLLATLNLIIRRHYVWSILPTTCLFLTHRPTALLWALTLFLASILLLKRDRQVAYVITLTTLIWWCLAYLCLIPVFDQLILNFVGNAKTWALFGWLWGTYLPVGKSLLFAIPTIGFLIITSASILKIWFASIKKLTTGYQLAHILSLSLLIVSSAWVFTGFVFYKRMIPFLEIGLMLSCAGYAFPQIHSSFKKKILVSIIATTQILTSTYFAYRYDHLRVPKEELESFKEIAYIVPKGSQIVSSYPHFYVSWIQGYVWPEYEVIWSTYNNIFGWSWAEWEKFSKSDGRVKCDMLYELLANQKMYSYLLINNNENYSWGFCLEKNSSIDANYPIRSLRFD